MNPSSSSFRLNLLNFAAETQRQKSENESFDRRLRIFCDGFDPAIDQPTTERLVLQ